MGLEESSCCHCKTLDSIKCIWWLQTQLERVAQAENALLEGKQAAAAMLQRHAGEISAEGAWEHVRMVLEKLVQGHEAVVSKLPSPSARCYSLQVAGCFQAGEFHQVCLACYLRHSQ